MCSRRIFSIILSLVSLSMGLPLLVHAQSDIIMLERFVPHTSTAPSNRGERVGIYLREKMSAAAADRWAAGQSRQGRVVLFVHGGTVSSIPDYDLDFKDYSWMEYLAEAGFDVFAMDHTGYGRSPRPYMDDPCNMSEIDQALVMPHPLSQSCDPSYSQWTSTIQSDWDEMASVVDYILDLRGVSKVSLIGWSAGGTRTGGYTARNPEKVDKLFLYAPGYRRERVTRSGPSVPMRLQTYETLTQGRWEQNVACDNQVDPGIRDVVWSTIMAFDPLGSVWGPSTGVMRVRTSGPYEATGFGWDQEGAARVTSPTMIVVGAQDNPESRGVLYADLSNVDSKVFVTMACSTHFAVWETSQYKFLHRASLEWLTQGSFHGETIGVFETGVNGSHPKRVR